MHRKVTTLHLIKRHWACCKNLPAQAIIQRNEGLSAWSHCTRLGEEIKLTLRVSSSLRPKKVGGFAPVYWLPWAKQKNHPDRQPIPRVQDIMDGLGPWFSLLDQGKAYHQGFMAEESRHLTALWPSGVSQRCQDSAQTAQTAWYKVKAQQMWVVQTRSALSGAYCISRRQ